MTQPPAGAWAPLRSPIFRRLWAAQVVSNLGTWMQTVAAQWVIVSGSRSELLVSLVQTASTLPVVLLAAPAGVLADVLDRRRVLVIVQLTMVPVAGLLAVLTFAGNVSPGVLLTFTFLLGCGAAFVAPAWQAIQPELVPRAQLPQAAALGAVNMNLGRAIGPAIGGALVAAAGAGWVFALNAVSFLVIAAAVASWQRAAVPDPVGRERMVAALRSGARYVRNAPSMRRILTQNVLFVPAASALWALLPVVADTSLGLEASGYGMLLGALGVGAVAAAAVLPALRRRLSLDGVLTLAFLAYAATLVGVALSGSLVLDLLALAVAGAAWMTLLSTLNATAQALLPEWVRARALSYYLVVFMGGQAMGGVVWGLVAGLTSVRTTLLIAAGLLALSAGFARRVRLGYVSGLDPTPSSHWATPEYADALDPQAGPVQVIVQYRVGAGQGERFIEAMGAISRSRRRTGAHRWELYRDPAEPERFVETFSVATWGEHARQHSGRLTVTDRRAEETAHAYLDERPKVSHLLSADVPLPTRLIGDDSDADSQDNGV